MGSFEAKTVSRYFDQIAKNRILAIIPARGGSKGVHRKNIRKLLGKPLINYTIEAAAQCPLIDRCIVSTEDQEIKQFSLEAGAEVIDRPIELATDTASSEDVVRHVLEDCLKKGELPEFLCCYNRHLRCATRRSLQIALRAALKQSRGARSV